MTSAGTANRRDDLPLVALIALLFLAPLSGMALSGMTPVMPLIGKEFAGLANAEILVRLMMSGLSAAMIFGALASGMLANRVGQLRLLLAALMVYAVSGSAIFLLDNLYAMVACRVVQGIANAAAGVLAMALITTRVAPSKRDKWLGFYLVSGTFGVLALFSAIGAIAHFGWRYTFLLFLLALPVALMLALTLPPEAKKDAASTGGETAAVGQKPPIPLALTAFGVLCGALASTSAMYLPYHLAGLGLGDPGTIAMLMIGGAAVSGAASLCFGWIRRYLSAIQIFVAGFLLNAAGLIAVVHASSAAAMLAALMIQGLGLGLLMPNAFSACAAATVPDLRARMLGFVRAGFYAGPLLIQSPLEVIYRRWDAGSAILAIGLLSLAGVVWVLAGRRQFDPVD